MSSTVAPPYQLLEINMISAQELAGISKSVEAYAVAWLNPERKLATQVDHEGHTNPTWNEKFVFRIDDNFLNSVIMIEIYSHNWIRDILIGTVTVDVSNLLPPNTKPKLRFVALQIRRPSSGRPQGILNISVNLLDATMPLYSDLSFSDTAGYSNKSKITKTSHDYDYDDDNNTYTTNHQSEKNDSTVNDYAYHAANAKHYGYDDDEEDSEEVGLRNRGFFNGMGASPSVVAEAIAKGLYPMPPPVPHTAGSSEIDGWSENTGTEGMKTKIRRWRNELTPAYEDDERMKVRDHAGLLPQTSKRVSQTPRRRGNGGGPCSCFGSVFGLEVTITYAGAVGNRRKGRAAAKGRGTTASSKLTYDDSYI